MSRKYKPALYELIGKSDLNPDGSGSMTTPDWFYTGKAKKNKSKVQESGDSQPSSSRHTVFTQISDRLRMPDFKARLKKKRLEISTNLWVVSLIGLALVLTHLMSFMLGQQGRVETVGDPSALAAKMEIPAAQEQADDSLKEIRQSKRRSNIYPPQDQAAALRKPDAAVMLAPESKPKALVDAKRESTMIGSKPVSGACLIICCYDNILELRPVQAYFNQAGLPMVIGRFQNKYVVYTRQTFEKSKGAGIGNLKKRIVQAGMKYNANKPKGALNLGAETFASAYPVNVSRIKNMDKR